MYVLLCFALVPIIASYPNRGYRFAPQRTVMFGGYYGQPLDGRSYIPQGMTFAAGDTIATNSFLGDREDQFSTRNEEESSDTSSQEILESSQPDLVDEVPVETDLRTTKTTNRVPKKKPQRPQKGPDSEDDSDNDDKDLPASWPFQAGGQNGVPSYNAFFPITFGGASGSSRTRSGDESGSGGFYPGSATAIANSFSTGKGGVATSHATSFGDPYLSTMLRNGNGNSNGRKGKKDQLFDE